MPSKSNVIATAIHSLPSVLGSVEEVAVADLELEVLATAVVVVLVVAAVGLTVGFATGSVTGSAVVMPASTAGSLLSPGSSYAAPAMIRLSVPTA